MREILFHGKRIDNGEWIEGNLITGTDWIDEKKIVAVVPLDNVFWPRCEISWWYEVDPNTVGQYTGLTDKYGKKVFKGDICKLKDSKYLVEFDYSSWQFNNLTDKDWPYPCFHTNCKYCEVIGNAYDNPELLKGAENE